MRAGARCRTEKIAGRIQRQPRSGPDAIRARLLTAETVDRRVAVSWTHGRQLENSTLVVGAAKICHTEDTAAGIQDETAERRAPASARRRRTEVMQQFGVPLAVLKCQLEDSTPIQRAADSCRPIKR